MKTPKPVVGLLYLATVAILGAVALVATSKQVTVGVLTRDMASTARLHPLTGILSNFGILIWCSAAAVSVFAGVVVPRQRDHRWNTFLLVSGLFTAVLLLDDLFLFHEDLARHYLGIPKQVVYAAYGAATVTYLIGFRRIILETEYALLAGALVFFVLSLMVDFRVFGLNPRTSPWYYLLEDGFKFVGIAHWGVYHIRTARAALLLTQPRTG